MVSTLMICRDYITLTITNQQEDRVHHLQNTSYRSL